MTAYRIRPAKEDDCEQIMKLIVELAEFEKMPEQVRINADVLRKDGFGENRVFYCVVAEPTETGDSEENSGLIGYCLFYYIYSTWEGKCCYMEDLYVTPTCRSQGVGTGMWREVTKIALANGCSRLHWAVLSWNRPAVELYHRRGGINLTEKEDWHLFRMTKLVMEDFVAQAAQ